MNNDKFFSQENCDRCGNDLSVRTMSWFNRETICLHCAEKESRIKVLLKHLGEDIEAYEGCGTIPDVKELERRVNATD
jgi:hypothetical protein